METITVLVFSKGNVKGNIKASSLTYIGNYIPSLQQVVIYKAFCLDLAQGLINRTPNETQTHL